MNLWFRLVWIVLTSLAARRVDPLQPVQRGFVVLPGDLDLNLHMTNSRYLALMDLGRMDLLLRSGMWRIIRRNRWAPVVGGCMVRFRRPLAPFQRATLSTRLCGWDDKWLYIEHRLISEQGLACQAMVRGAFLRNGKVVAPEQVARTCGFARGPGAVPEPWQIAWDGFRDAAA